MTPLDISGDFGPLRVLPSGGAWKKIYQVDFTAQASKSLAAAGSHLIDGKTWWAKGSLTGATCELVNGAGLRMMTPSLVQANYAATSGASTNWRSLYLPLDDLAGFKRTLPFGVLWRWGSVTPQNNGSINAHCGLAELPENASDAGSAAWGTSIAMGTHESTPTSSSVRSYYGSGGSNFSTVTDAYSSQQSHVYGMFMLNDTLRYLVNGLWSSGFPDPQDMQNGPAIYKTTAFTSRRGFYMGHKKFSNGVGDLDAYLTDLKVVQLA